MADRRINNKLPICKQCTTSIERDADGIDCEGFCRNAFHVTCAKLSAEVIASVRTRPNIWWICDKCTPLMREKRNDHISKQLYTSTSVIPPKGDENMNYASEILALKRQIAEIQETLADTSIIKPKAESSSSLATHPPLAQSSPLTSSKLQLGTKPVNDSNITVSSGSSAEKFWLFFTKIKNDVTELDMSRMIGDSLSPEASIEVKKLIPVWKNPLTMPYISFKAGIDVRFKEAALLSSTWPAGLCFREFRNCVWEPLHQIT